MKALILLADDFEEIEAITVVDVLRRAGIEITAAGLTSDIVEGSHKIRIVPDKGLNDISDNDIDCYDALILPGGPGYKKLMEERIVINLIKEFDNKNKLIAAICAAPAVLGRAGILEYKRATIYPGMEQAIPRPISEKVIIDKNIITSQGPGTAMLFALKLVEVMAGEDTAKRLKAEMIIGF